MDVFVEHMKRMVEYYTTIASDPQNLEAIWSYKGAGYRTINGLLTKMVNVHLKNTSDPRPMRELLREDYLNLKEKLDQKVMFIDRLDGLIRRAPQLPRAVDVYRGVNGDSFITQSMYCVNNKIYVQFPTYISTSFDKRVAKQFANNDVFLTLQLPRTTRGLFLPSMPFQFGAYENQFPDTEFEFLLPRDCVFEVVSVKLKGLSIRHLKNKQLSCNLHKLPAVKHYTLRLVRQPPVRTDTILKDVQLIPTFPLRQQQPIAFLDIAASPPQEKKPRTTQIKKR